MGGRLPVSNAAHGERRPLAEERLRSALACASVATWHWDLRTGALDCSEVALDLLGIAPDEPTGLRRFLAAVHPEDRAGLMRAARAALSGDACESEFRSVRPDGSARWICARGRALGDCEGRPLLLEGVAFDVTHRKTADEARTRAAPKQLEHALREGEVRFRNLADAVSHLIWQLDPTGRVMYANRRWRAYLGRTSLAVTDWSEVVHPDDLGRVVAAFSEMTLRESHTEAFRMRRFDGTYHWFVCRTVPVRDPEGNLLHVVGTSTDVDAVKEAEEALRLSRTRLDAALKAAGMGTGAWEIDSGRMVLDDSLLELLGLTVEQAQHASLERMMARVHLDDREPLRLALTRARDRQADYDVEFRIERPDGRMLWLACKGRIEEDADGRPRRLFGACVDITHHKRLEEDLRQAQKMEAIGQLAGGVAHDFNNLLTVILGQATVVGRRRDLPAGVADSVRDIASAAERAASLTSQLLAFGRRQVMQLRDLALDDVVANIGTMLKRLLGENVALEIEAMEPGLRVRADPNMLAQILLNLAVNARDAMPDGGRLTIRTGTEWIDPRTLDPATEAVAGAWACLAVSDTGAGIPPDVLPRIFEPFFTTKGVGKGTGLGLATVYGIVKQHRGFLAVESAVGRGTTFRAFFPMADEAARPAADAKEARAQPGRGELVLLVEDEGGIRSVVKSILEQHGYRLIIAKDGPEALRAFEERGAEVDLLLSDVVMPNGVTGTNLVAELVGRRPGLKAILCSGYSEETVGSGFASLPGTAFLQKPYRAEELLQLVRTLLDG